MRHLHIVIDNEEDKENLLTEEIKKADTVQIVLGASG
jgi:hypothetical protein